MRSRNNQPLMVRRGILVPPAGSTVGRFLKSNVYPRYVKPLLDEFIHHQGRPPRRLVQNNLHYVTEKYLPYLEHDIVREITPRLADYGRVREALQKLADPDNRLPAPVASKAREIYEKFEAIGWDASRPIRPVIQTSDDYPPSDHPIWGDHGIMHGLVLYRGPGGNLRCKLDDRFQPQNAHVVGDDHLRVGQWFPRQASAILHGAHSQPIRGISGDPERGAYSIVVSGEYYDVDRDEGDIIYYSGEGGTGKDSGKKTDSKLNQALHASWRLGTPVRVLRSSKLKSIYAPACGIRYDGLYRIVSVQAMRNSDGGRFDQFKLVRLPNQRSLEDVCRESPTVQQIHDFERINLGY